MIGVKLTPILSELEQTLWEFEANNPNTPPCYGNDAMKYAAKIFMSVTMDRFWREKNSTHSIAEMAVMAENLGKEIRQMILSYTGVDMHKEYAK